MPSRMLSRGIGLPLCPGGMYANMRVFGSMMRKTPERRGPAVSKWLRIMYCSVCAIPTVQCASTISLVRALIIEGFAMKEALPVSTFTARQLKELKMNHFNVDSCAGVFTVDPSKIVKYRLDTMSFKAILRHPYLEYEDVQMIFNAKRKYDSLSFQLLEEKKVLPAYKLKKIKPYFQ